MTTGWAHEHRAKPLLCSATVRPVPLDLTFLRRCPTALGGQATRWRVPFPLHYHSAPVHHQRRLPWTFHHRSASANASHASHASHASPTSRSPLAATKWPRCCRQPLSRRPLCNGRCSRRRADSPTLLLADTKRHRRRRHHHRRLLEPPANTDYSNHCSGIYAASTQY